MNKIGVNRCWGLIVFILVICCVVSAAPVSIDLGKTYEEKGMRISTIESVDLADLSESSVEILSTSGDGSDIKILEMPCFGNVHRTFPSTHAEFKGMSLDISRSEMSDLNWKGMPPFRIYVTHTVPTLRINVPGWQGNPVVMSSPDGPGSVDMGDLSGFLNSAEPVYIYHQERIVRVDPAENEYTGFGAFDASHYNDDNIPYTLEQNLVSLDSGFTTPAALSSGYAGVYPDNVLKMGRSAAGAFYLDNASEKMTVLAGYPVVILDQNSEMEWAWEGSGLEFEFTPAYTHQAELERTVVLLIKSEATYDVDIEVDVSEMARRAEGRWNDLGSAVPLIDILYGAIREEIGPGVYTYSLTASGGSAPSPATGWSNLAISDGYGYLGNSENANVIVPVSALGDLLPGRYYVYLMGLNSQNEIIALDQKMLDMARPMPVAAFSATPLTGTGSLTVEFIDESEGSPDSWSWDFGDGSSSTEQNPSHTYGVGEFDVCLTVSNSAGSDNITKTDYIKIARSYDRSSGRSSHSSGSSSQITDASPTSVSLSDIEETATPQSVLRSEKTRSADSAPSAEDEGEGNPLWFIAFAGLCVALLGAYVLMRPKD